MRRLKSTRVVPFLIPLFAGLPLYGAGCGADSGSDEGSGEGSGDVGADAVDDASDAGSLADTSDSAADPDIQPSDATDSQADDTDSLGDTDTYDSVDGSGDTAYDVADVDDDADVAETSLTAAEVEAFCSRYADCAPDYFSNTYDTIEECVDVLEEYTDSYFGYLVGLGGDCEVAGLAALDCFGARSLPAECPFDGDFEPCFLAERAVSAACGFTFDCTDGVTSIGDEKICDGALDCPEGDDEYACFD